MSARINGLPYLCKETGFSTNTGNLNGTPLFLVMFSCSSIASPTVNNSAFTRSCLLHLRSIFLYLWLDHCFLLILFTLRVDLIKWKADFKCNNNLSNNKTQNRRAHYQLTDWNQRDRWAWKINFDVTCNTHGRGGKWKQCFNR